MTVNAKIRRTRATLIAIVIAGLALGTFSLMIGIGLPGFILSAVGWIAFVITVVWLIAQAIRKPASATQAAPWRPADQN